MKGGQNDIHFCFESYGTLFDIDDFQYVTNECQKNTYNIFVFEWDDTKIRKRFISLPRFLSCHISCCDVFNVGFSVWHGSEKSLT